MRDVRHIRKFALMKPGKVDCNIKSLPQQLIKKAACKPQMFPGSAMRKGSEYNFFE